MMSNTLPIQNRLDHPSQHEKDKGTSTTLQRGCSEKTDLTQKHDCYCF